MQIRRVVTGEDASGTGVFANIEEIPAIKTDFGEWAGVWGWDALPTLPVNPTDGWQPPSKFPPVGGVRVSFITFSPSEEIVIEQEDLDAYQRLEDARSRSRVTEADGMHKHDTIDIAFVIEGELGVEEENREEVTLKKGDLLVQNGSKHRWHHRSGKPTTLGFIVFSASREDAA